LKGGPVVSVRSKEDSDLFLAFFKSRSDRLYARLCEYGVTCGSHIPDLRPDRRTLRVLAEPLRPNGPRLDWHFKARSDTSDLRAIIGITRWGRITKA
jgi:hypothetical protein